MKGFAHGTLFAVAAALVAACGGTAGPTVPRPTADRPMATNTAKAATQKATLMLDWTPNTNHTGIYVALAKGYYKDEGIELEIQQPGTAIVPNQVVAENKVQFAISSQEQVVLDRGQGLPIVSIAAIIQHNTSGFAGTQDSGIKDIKELAGKRYGAFGAPFEKPFLEALMKCAGADASTIQYIQLGPSSDYRAMLGREIDVTWIFYAWDGVASEVAGHPYSVIMLKDHTDCVPDYYTPLILTNEKLIASDPGLVKRFMRATAKGYEFAIKHPDEAADLLMEQVPELKTSADIVKASQKWLAPQYQADASRWGEQSAEVWDKFAEFALNAKILDKPMDMSKVFSNDYLP